MKIFFDTEFANFGEHINSKRHLISIGLIAMDGREFYAESTDSWDEHLCSNFVIENVLPLLQGGEHAMSISVLNSRLKAWLESFEPEVTLMSDHPPYDWQFIQELFDYGGWPANLKRSCSLICFEENSQKHRYGTAIADYWKTNEGKQHHALHDARSMRFAWKYAMRTKRRQS